MQLCQPSPNLVPIVCAASLSDGLHPQGSGMHTLHGFSLRPSEILGLFDIKHVVVRPRTGLSSRSNASLSGWLQQIDQHTGVDLQGEHAGGSRAAGRGLQLPRVHCDARHAHPPLPLRPPGNGVARPVHRSRHGTVSEAGGGSTGAASAGCSARTQSPFPAASHGAAHPPFQQPVQLPAFQSRPRWSAVHHGAVNPATASWLARPSTRQHPHIGHVASPLAGTARTLA